MKGDDLEGNEQSPEVGVTIAMSSKVFDDNFRIGEEIKKWWEARADLIVRTNR